MHLPEPPKPSSELTRDELIRADIEDINDAIGSLSELRPEARELARSGHPAKKHEGTKAVQQIQSEIRRLSAERRQLKDLLPKDDNAG